MRANGKSIETYGNSGHYPTTDRKEPYLHLRGQQFYSTLRRYGATLRNL